MVEPALPQVGRRCGYAAFEVGGLDNGPVGISGGKRSTAVIEG